MSVFVSCTFCVPSMKRLRLLALTFALIALHAATVGLAQGVVKARSGPANVLSGVVFDPEGKPVSGAMLTPRGYMLGNDRMIGPMEKVALSVVANDKGEFKIDTLIPVDSLDVEVRAKGFAPYFFQQVAVGHRQTLALERGVTVVGRVVRNGKPLAGVAMVVTWTERRSDGFSGPREAVTDEDGHFEIPNVTAHRAIFLYGRMSSLTGRGALPRESFTTGDNGSTLDVAAIKGDLNLERGFTVFGRVILSDGKPVPKGSRVNLVRAGCADNQTVEIGGNGEFAICDVPATSAA
jgi:hypothetical protein